MRAVRLTHERWAGGLAALAAVVVGVVQLRDGIVHLLDTVTYWSGAEQVASGRPLTTRLAPSFTNFDAVEFLDRGGRLPFVDFPVGYPLVAGLVGAVVGVRASMQILVVAALAVIASAVVFGDRLAGHSTTSRLNFARLGWLVLVGISIVSLPTTRLVTQGVLSETLFCASALGLVMALVRYRQGGRWWPVAILTVTTSLLRFIGAPLALLAGWEHWRRTGDRRGSVTRAAVLMIPAAANIVLASAFGGGHNAGWRGLDRLDVDVFVRSVGGWFDSRQGDLRRTYFTGEGPAWWAWLVVVSWFAVLAYVAIAYLRGRSRLPAASEIALMAAGIVTAGLVAGIMGFDALVIADNRLMLPSGVLTLAAIAWAVPRSRRALIAAATVTLAWIVVAVDPSSMAERFSDEAGIKPYSVAALETGASVVISNDADGVHWDTGIPTAYAPTPVKMLTGETVDVEPVYAAMPCALLEADGAVVLSDEAMFFAADLELLDREVDNGRLTRTDRSGAIVYEPTASACD
ncbi:MAG: hypothetical protein RL547_899 [Actinomycetota bacterium]